MERLPLVLSKNGFTYKQIRRSAAALLYSKWDHVERSRWIKVPTGSTDPLVGPYTTRLEYLKNAEGKPLMEDRLVGYEVFQCRVQPASEFNGVQFKEKELFPGNEAFGKWAFYFGPADLTTANHCFEKMDARKSFGSDGLQSQLSTAELNPKLTEELLDKAEIVRERLQTFLTESPAVTLTSIGKRIGYSKTVMSLFLSDSYKGNIAKVTRALELYLDAQTNVTETQG
jgi:hypothetical protein